MAQLCHFYRLSPPQAKRLEADEYIAFRTYMDLYLSALSRKG